MAVRATRSLSDTAHTVKQGEWDTCSATTANPQYTTPGGVDVQEAAALSTQPAAADVAGTLSLR